MPEETKHNAAPTTEAPNASAALSASNPNPHDKHYPHTAGEKLFNAGTYYGIGWILNAITSVVITDQVRNVRGAPLFDSVAERFKDSAMFRQGKLQNAEEKAIGSQAFGQLTDKLKQEVAREHGAEAFIQTHPEHSKSFNAKLGHVLEQFEADVKLAKQNKPAENLQKIIGEHFKDGHEDGFLEKLKLGMETALSKRKAGSLFTITALCSGGFIFMFPIKWLEDRKEKLVIKADDMLGQKDKTFEEQQLIEARHKQIAREPDQSLGSVFASRLAGVGLVLGINYGLGQPKNILSHMGIQYKGNDHYFEKAGEKISHYLQNPANPKLKSMSDGWIKKFDKTNATLVAEKGEQFAQSGATRLGRLAEFSVADMGYSFIAATTMYVTSRLLSVFAMEKKTAQEANAQLPSDLHMPVSQAPATNAAPQTSKSSTLEGMVDVPAPLEKESYAVHGHTVQTAEAVASSTMDAPESKISSARHAGHAAHAEHHKNQDAAHAEHAHHDKHEKHDAHSSKRHFDKSVSYSEMAKQSQQHHGSELGA